MSPPGVSVAVECRMGAGFAMSSYTMLWYRQNRHGALVEFLIKEYEETAGRFHSSIDTANNSFSLQITRLSVNDSSTYYCAARHSDAPTPHAHADNTDCITHTAHRQEEGVCFRSKCQLVVCFFSLFGILFMDEDFLKKTP
ncbi:unnamed protein product [Menidia menidia]|uniref:(Atlantic silverside) hypothetical protein n=1 Tax=Menidia menidia TaxID=238744 RepID=A0A8S4AKI6_9TELE|nr:unnamed protein product [Menidia menidia]